MRLIHSLFILLTLLSAHSPVLAVEWGEDAERLMGFAQHNQIKKKFNQERLSGVDEVKRRQAAWEKERQAAIGEYQAWRQEQAASSDESGADYKAYLESKRKKKLAYEKSRQSYVQEKRAQQALKKARVPVTEAQELGLDETGPRADFEKRALYGGKQTYKYPMSQGSGVSRGRVDFASPPPPVSPEPEPEFEAPAPPPEFFEPEIPPPPVDFDDPIPPPVFEDPEDF